VKAAAASRDLSLRDYVELALRRALKADVLEEAERRDWSRLSARSFARDWESEEDRAYDQLARG
jgi:hypothetical protein